MDRDEMINANSQKHLIDRQSVLLLLVLTVPICLMALLLLIWPNFFWRAEVPFSVVDMLGSSAMVLLSIFLLARYGRHRGVLYFSAALVTMSVTEGFFLFITPEASQFLWLKFFSGMTGGLLATGYILARQKCNGNTSGSAGKKHAAPVLIGAAVISALICGIILKFSSAWPALSANNIFTGLGWSVYGLIVSVLCFAGSSLFVYHRKTGSLDLLPIAAVLIFIFQGNIAAQIASPWGIVWWFWQGMRVAVFISVFIFVSGEYIRVSNSLMEEVKERKRFAAELEEANSDWRGSFNSLEDAMFIIGSDFRIRNLNNSAERLLSGTKQELKGQFLNRAVHSGTLSPGAHIFCESLAIGKPISIEEYNNRLGRHFVIKCSPVADHEGSKSRFVVLLHDVTVRVQAEFKERKMQQELAQASRMAAIGELAATVAHEMNNPLTSVIGFSELLRQAEVSEDIKENLEIIHHSAQRAAGVVQKLFSFARHRKEERRPVDINSLVSLVVKMRSHELYLNNIVVKTNLCAALPLAVLDSAQIEQVLLNIIINAEQAMFEKHKGGKLFIRTSSEGDRIVIRITDNGPGIVEENIERIFDTFFTTRTEDGGNGLGLGVSRSIISDHGGRIFARSLYGHGACFIIELPTGIQNSPDCTVPLQALPLPQLGASVLVIDDELSIRLMINRVLSREGYSVEAVADARTALEECRKRKFDLILADIRMPEIDGIDLYYKLVECEPGIRSKIIFLTGGLSEKRNRSFLTENNLPFIAKPFGIRELRQQVESTIAGNSKIKTEEMLREDILKSTITYLGQVKSGSGKDA